MEHEEKWEGGIVKELKKAGAQRRTKSAHLPEPDFLQETCVFISYIRRSFCCACLHYVLNSLSAMLLGGHADVTVMNFAQTIALCKSSAASGCYVLRIPGGDSALLLQEKQ